ncbi:catalase-related domain-containing protein, partial [Bacillus pumilus]|uniref:catalase-related domain-containing protein n=1 Tax=Bacillus pumilus TaxID=1408 RepID=UPI0028CB5409
KEGKEEGKDDRGFVEGEVKGEGIEGGKKLGEGGERYGGLNDWEGEELIKKVVKRVGSCEKDIEEQMMEKFRKGDGDYGKGVAEGLKGL